MGGCCTSKDHRENDGLEDAGAYPENYHPVFPTELVGSYSTHGRRGRDPKQNQDTGLVVGNFAGNVNQMFFLVCDGHGSQGHHVSQLASKSIVDFLEKDPRMKDMLAHREMTQGGVVQALTDACENSQDELKEKMKREAYHSGTTCVACAINLNHVWTACVGDSRAVIGAKKGNQPLALDLSVDQNCANTLEKARIRAKKGEIAEFGGFERVVSPNHGTVLAPTRSIGDCEFDPIGVCPTPEVTHYKLTGQEHVLILASDGLWEFISSSQAVKLAMSHKNATQACDALVRLSMEKWKQDATGQYCDDITIIVIFLPLLDGQCGANQVAMNRVQAGPGDVDADDIELHVDDIGETDKANAAAQPSAVGRRRSMSNLDGNQTGSDASVVDLAKRNIENFSGLNPNARENIPNRSWSPEFDAKMWPKGSSWT